MTRLAAALLAALNRHRRIPAAPDNQPGRDAAALWTCRRINTTPRQEGK